MRDVASLRRLSGTLERAKFPIHRMLTTHGPRALHWFQTYVDGPTQRAGPITGSVVVLPMALSMLSKHLFTEGWTYFTVSSAISERETWRGVLEQRFPSLRHLNNVTHEEWDELLPEGLLRSFGRWISSLRSA